MTARTHDLAAITALAVVVVAQPFTTVTLGTALLVLLANQIGGIVPDIDQPTAPFWRNLPIGKIFGRFADRLLGGHRFITHSLLGLALFGFLAKTLLVFLHPIMPRVNTGYVWWGFMIGMLSHLVMDTFTKEGVPWLLPVPIKFGFPPLKRLRVTTGKKMEYLFIVPILLAIDFWLIASHYQLVFDLIHKHLV